LYYNVERLAGIVKEGGIIDYEEYWNRAAVGTGITNGHYSLPTGFGNYGKGGVVGIGGSFGSGTYLCTSPSGAFMGTGGCLISSNENATNMSGPQQYGQYALQYFDANANIDGDGGDEDGDGKITGDEDDEDLGSGPAAFPYGAALRELYLIKKGGTAPERLVLRWNVITDPDAPMGFGCSVSAD
jgi:hypothetical protein